MSDGTRRSPGIVPIIGRLVASIGVFALGSSMLLRAQAASGQSAQQLKDAVSRAETASTAAGKAAQQAQATGAEARKAADEAKTAAAAAAAASQRGDEQLKAAVEKTAAAADRLGTVTNALTFLVTLITVLGAIAAGVAGWGLFPYLKKAMARAKQLNRQSFVLESLQSQFEKSLKKIEDRFAGKFVNALIGDEPPKVPQEDYDADAFITFGYQLNLASADPKRFAGSMVIVGRYWRSCGEFPRALARLRSAIELDPDSMMGHQQLARALWNSVGQERLRSNVPLTAEEASRLKEAESRLHVAKTKASSNGEENPDLLADFAALKFCKGEFEEAAKLYQEAAAESTKIAAKDKHEPDWVLTFALACALARAGQFQRAFDTLSVVAGKKTAWDSTSQAHVEIDFRDWIRREKDLETMRAIPEWDAKLTNLARQAAPTT